MKNLIHMNGIYTIIGNFKCFIRHKWMCVFMLRECPIMVYTVKIRPCIMKRVQRKVTKHFCTETWLKNVRSLYI